MSIEYNNTCAIPIIAKIVHSQKLMREGTRNRNTTWDGLLFEPFGTKKHYGYYYYNYQLPLFLG